MMLHSLTRCNATGRTPVIRHTMHTIYLTKTEKVRALTPGWTSNTLHRIGRRHNAHLDKILPVEPDTVLTYQRASRNTWLPSYTDNIIEPSYFPE